MTTNAPEKTVIERITEQLRSTKCDELADEMTQWLTERATVENRRSVLLEEAIALLVKSRNNFHSKDVAQAREILERIR